MLQESNVFVSLAPQYWYMSPLWNRQSPTYVSLKFSYVCKLGKKFCSHSSYKSLLNGRLKHFLLFIFFFYIILCTLLLLLVSTSTLHNSKVHKLNKRSLRLFFVTNLIFQGISRCVSLESVLDLMSSEDGPSAKVFFTKVFRNLYFSELYASFPR